MISLLQNHLTSVEVSPIQSQALFAKSNKLAQARFAFGGKPF